MLTIQFGQCGNQLGSSLFSKILADTGCTNTGVSRGLNHQYMEDSFSNWFAGVSKSGKHVARAILIDADQKVINNVCTQTMLPWTYNKTNVINKLHGGSANNWAYGYMVNGPQVAEEILKSVQQDMDKSDSTNGIFLILNSAGGTGSGVGSYVVKHLREEYPTKSIAAIIVLPFVFGEVATQSYNTLLTLAHFYDKVDTIILFENETLHHICSKVLKKGDILLDDLNEIIAERLCAISQPLDVRCTLSSLITEVVCHPSYKLTTIKNVPQILITATEYDTVSTWHSYIRNLKQMLKVSDQASKLTDAKLRIPNASNNMLKYSRSISNILFTRGMNTQKDRIITDELQDKNLYSKWASLNRFTHMHQTRCCLNQDKVSTLLTNNSDLCNPIDAFLSTGWKSYCHSAFLHNYTKFGLEEDDFLHTFSKVESINKDYKTLC